MNQKTLVKLLLAACALLALGGCTTRRYVTASHWSGDKSMYLAYTEHTPGFPTATTEAKVLKCDPQADNSLQCSPQENLNAALNAAK